MFDIETLEAKSSAELTKITKDLGIKTGRGATMKDKVYAILDFQASNPQQTKDYYNATETVSEKKESHSAQEQEAPEAVEKKTDSRKKRTSKTKNEDKGAVEEKKLKLRKLKKLFCKILKRSNKRLMRREELKESE